MNPNSGPTTAIIQSNSEGSKTASKTVARRPSFVCLKFTWKGSNSYHYVSQPLIFLPLRIRLAKREKSAGPNYQRPLSRNGSAGRTRTCNPSVNRSILITTYDRPLIHVLTTNRAGNLALDGDDIARARVVRKVKLSVKYSHDWHRSPVAGDILTVF